jgi:proteasome lid subunit RPN8/RPN11
MIEIPQHILDAILSHARSELPHEACGLLSGTGSRVLQHHPMTNVDHSPEHFSFAPAEQFAAMKEARARGLQILANYHSHPSSPARPSAEDIRLAYDPRIIYLIISLSTPQPVVRAFRIVRGEVEPLEIHSEG